MRERGRAGALRAVCLCAALGCSGSIESIDGPESARRGDDGRLVGPDGTPIGPGGDSAGSGPGGGGSSGSGAVAAGSGADSGSGALPGPDVLAPVLPAPDTRAARLTHAQWENTLRDLFRVDDSVILPDASGLRADPVQSGFVFDNAVGSLVVDDGLISGYERAAAEVAALVIGDAALLANIAPPDTLAADERRDTFVRDFGLRAHRRPLSAEMVGEYTTLFDMGPALYTGLGAFESGARAVVEAMLQSPYFLYRIEESSEELDGVIPLDAYEVASRLSYALWNSMPDDLLFEAAGDASLLEPAQLTAQVQRLLGDDRAREVVLDFHRQLFEAERFEGISPSQAFFPDVSPTLGESAVRELDRFVEYQVFEQGGGFGDLLTSTETFANADLAPIYGLSGDFDDALVRVDLDPGQRRGVLTQVGFLAGHATSVNPDPIHRGVFVARRIACTHIAAPPANIPPVPEPEPGATNRETIAAHTEDPQTVCATCHSTLINPFGFPFEGYDAVGGFRTEDNGQPVDATAMPQIGGTRVQVDDALELIDELASSDTVHACYVEHWLQYALGRELAEQDAGLIALLARESLENGASIEELIAGLVTSRAFLNRSTEELP